MDEKEFFEKLKQLEEDKNENEQEAKKEEQFLKENKNNQESDFEEGSLAVDVYQTPTSFVVESPIAGIDEDDLDISITPEMVTIKGKRKKRTEIKDDDYVYQECFWGNFSRSIILPEEIDPDKAHAVFKKGILKITLPKIHRSKSKKIKVKFE